MPQRTVRPLYVFIALAVMGIVAAGAVVVLCAYFSLSGFSAAFSGCKPSNVKELENAGQFKLPPSAQNLKSGCFGMQGWDGHAEFEMLPSDLDVLIASTKLKTPLSANDLPKDSGLITPASQAKSYLHGRYDSYVPKTDTTYYRAHFNLLQVRRHETSERQRSHLTQQRE